MKFVKIRALPIGLDIGSSAVKMAQLRATGDELELVGACSFDLPKELRAYPRKRLDFIGRNIRSRMLKNHEFKGRQCIFSLPAESTFLQHVKIPKLPSEQMEQAINCELSGKLPYPVERAVIRYVVAGEAYGESEPKHEVIVVAADRAVLDTYLDMAGSANLDVIGVNMESCAVVECFSRLFRRAADAARAVLYVDIGMASTQVALSHGERLVFARNLAIGGEIFDKALGESMKVPAEQAGAIRRDMLKNAATGPSVDELYRLLDGPVGRLADELLQCLRYYESVFHNHAIERAIFVGGQAYDKRLCQTIAQRLNVPAQIGDPLLRVGRVGAVGLDIGLDRRDPQPNWAVAVGLSIGGAKAA
jgi:type IV pilus assembly protein PilM